MGTKTSESWLQPGEMVVMKVAANHTEGRIARGGRLWLTNQRLIFSPHALDRALRADSVNLALSGIAKVSRESAGCGPRAWFSGGLRARLRVDLVDGSVHLFVVNRLDSVIKGIQQQLGGGQQA